MRFSQAFIPTRKEDPADAELVSHRLMTRAGMLRKHAAGIYSLLPMGWRAASNVMRIVREELNREGAQELSLPILMPSELWKESGRWEKYGRELSASDRHDREYAVGRRHGCGGRPGPSHVRPTATSLNLTSRGEFRDEVRPASAVRAREFLMKAAKRSRRRFLAEEGYEAIAPRLHGDLPARGLSFVVVEADSGAIGATDH